jgi:AAA+ superfamily predicted ATPase
MRIGRGRSSSGDGSAVPGEERGIRYLLGRLALVEERVHVEVQRRQRASDDPSARGLLLSDEQVARMLRDGPARTVPPSAQAREALADLRVRATQAVAEGADVRLARLAAAFGLDELDEEILLIALAPAVDVRFETLYAYLNEDVTRRGATVGLALALCGVSPLDPDARARFAPDAVLGLGLIDLSGEHRALIHRNLDVPERVVAFLLGDDAPDPAVEAVLLPAPPVAGPAAERIARAVGGGARTVYVRDVHGSGAASQAAAGLAAAGLEALNVDLSRLPEDVDLGVLARACQREALLQRAGLIVGPLERFDERSPAAVRLLSESRCPVVLHGRPVWDPEWSRSVPSLVDADRITTRETVGGIVAALGEDLGDVDAVEAIGLFRLTPAQVERAAVAARQQATMEGRPLAAADLQRGGRAQSAAGLERLARRIEPRATWDDLVLPDDAMEQLRQLAIRWRQRDRVLDEWGMGRGASRGRGVSALFAGDSGTGKTMAAEVVASDLGLDLYIVELSTVIDKYIGETSKNLERIFSQADKVNGVLLFDEADALFGKRSSVSDAKDRHANVEVAYLLQRMESFDGVAILTTNLSSNLDDAFVRRLDAIVDFPSPDAAQRELLWRAKLRPELPQDADIDVGFLADRFKLSGAEIRNVVITAAYLAGEEGSAVGMRHLVRGLLAEHRKMGRYLPETDLGPYATLLADGRHLAAGGTGTAPAERAGGDPGTASGSTASGDGRPAGPHRTVAR